jgi:hypothetical protein
MRRLFTSPFAPLVGMSLATAAFLCEFVAARMTPAPVLELLIALGWALLLVIWVEADARRRKRLPCFDLGLLAVAWFPISVACYCVWSRGWGRGLLVLLALLGLWLMPRFLAAFLWVMLRIVSP